MLKRVELTPEKKSEVIKLFCKSEKMKELVEEFIKSFKVLEGRQDTTTKSKDPEEYVIWSSILQKTIRIPVKELLG